MKFTVKTTGNWAEVKEFETLKEALQEFEMVAQGNFHYYIAKGVEEPYKVMLLVDDQAICALNPTSCKSYSMELGDEYVEFTEKEKGTITIDHFNADGAKNHWTTRFDTYTVQYDC